MVWNPIIFLSPALCSKCNTESIELYDYFGNPLGYSEILYRRELGLDPDLNHRAIYEMKCRKCNSKYPIVWENGFPLPDLRDIPLIQQFINEYIMGSEI